MNNVCENCKYWAEIITHPKFGRCRKNPPLLMLGMIDKEEEPKKADWAVWPRTYFSDWCGMWAAIEPASVFDKMVQFPPFTDFLSRLEHNRTAYVLRENKVVGWSELFKADFDWFKNCGPVTRRDIARTCYELTKTVPPQLARYYQPPTQPE